MTRKAIRVRDDRGIYDLVLGAEPEDYRDVRREATTIDDVEQLLGWGSWRWSVRVDGQRYFVDGSRPPRERRAAP